MIEKAPALPDARQHKKRGITKVGSCAAAEVREVDLGSIREMRRKACRNFRGPRLRVGRLPQPQPFLGKAVHSAMRSRTWAIVSAVRPQSGKVCPCRQAPSAFSRLRAGFDRRERSAPAKAATSPVAQTKPAELGTVSLTAPSPEAMTGRPCAMASAKAMP